MYPLERAPKGFTSLANLHLPAAGHCKFKVKTDSEKGGRSPEGTIGAVFGTVARWMFVVWLVLDGGHTYGKGFWCILMHFGLGTPSLYGMVVAEMRQGCKSLVKMFIAY